MQCKDPSSAKRIHTCTIATLCANRLSHREMAACTPKGDAGIEKATKRQAGYLARQLASEMAGQLNQDLASLFT